MQAKTVKKTHYCIVNSYHACNYESNTAGSCKLLTITAPLAVPFNVQGEYAYTLNTLTQAIYFDT